MIKRMIKGFPTESDAKACERVPGSWMIKASGSRVGRQLGAVGDARPPAGVRCFPKGGRSTFRAKSPPSGEARCAHRGQDRPAGSQRSGDRSEDAHPTPRRSRRWSGVPIRVEVGAR